MFEVYIDGSFINNKGGWSQFWIDKPELNKYGKLLPDEKQTCARAEVRALYEALLTIYNNISDDQKVIIYSDNIYCVNGYNDWMHKWVFKNFPKEHPDLWRSIYDIYKIRKNMIEVKHVPAHRNIYGNECADKLAKEATLL